MAVCNSPVCGKESESVLKCPVCLKQEISSVFCNQTCFRSAWPTHRYIHATEAFDPFPTYNYTGDLRAKYPLSPRRDVPKHIKVPDYAHAGKPISEIKHYKKWQIPVLNDKQIEKMRKVTRLSREILDITASHVRPGITTDELDAILHRECIKRNAYPSPLNYYNFPKSLCTSVNEVICHGIPDKTTLKDGDIVNLDVSIFYLGLHSDLNETYYVGDKAKADPDIVSLVETTRESLNLAIAAVKPGIPFRDLGNIIEAHATKNNCSVVTTYCGHGTGEFFHCQPDIPHYAKNKAVGVAKPGMVFTIEPMLCLGTHKDISWPDNWTIVTQDGRPSAQFEQMLLVTDTGVEVLTARTKHSPGGAIPRI